MKYLEDRIKRLAATLLERGCARKLIEVDYFVEKYVTDRDWIAEFHEHWDAVDLGEYA